MEKEKESTLNILLVEDEKINQKVVSGLLQKRGWRVYYASNGEEAIKLCNLKKFDLILMDLYMPKIDGVEATLTIREMERLKEQYTPIIAITASDSYKERQKCADAGMDEYITKPISGTSLYTAIQKVLTMSINDIMNIERTLDNLDGDKELLIELMEDFIDDDYSRLVLEEIKTSIKLKDSSTLYKKAHKLKGAAACLNIQSIYQTALELEELGKKEQIDNCETIFETLKRDYEEIKTSFKTYIKNRSI